VRYYGQSYTLNVVWSNIKDVITVFHDAHEQRYGHRLEQPVELVNIRLGLRAPNKPLKLADIDVQNTVNSAEKTTTVYGMKNRVPVWSRGMLVKGQIVNGPALITEQVSTTWLAPGWQCEVHKTGSLILTKL